MQWIENTWEIWENIESCGRQAGLQLILNWESLFCFRPSVVGVRHADSHTRNISTSWQMKGKEIYDFRTARLLALSRICEWMRNSVDILQRKLGGSLVAQLTCLQRAGNYSSQCAARGQRRGHQRNILFFILRAVVLNCELLKVYPLIMKRSIVLTIKH